MVRPAGLLVTAVLLAGCGGAEGSDAAVPAATPGVSPSVTADAAPSRPAPGLTGLTDRAAAQRILIAAAPSDADLPGYRYLAGEVPTAEDGAQLYACLGIPEPKYLERGPNSTLVRGGLSIGFRAELITSAAVARETFGVEQARSQECIVAAAEAFDERIKPALTAVEGRVAGAEGTIVYALTYSNTVGDLTERYTGYYLIAYAGQLRIQVNANAAEGTKPSLEQVLNVAAAAISRASAAAKVS